jgi:glycosyltransferase involved in cell wall biosynthesis
VVWNYSENDIYVNEIKSLGIPLHFFPSGMSRLKKLQALHDLTQRLKPEIIHSYSFYTNFAAHWAAQGMKTVAVGSLRGDFHRAKQDSGPLLGCLSARWPQNQISNSVSSAEKAQHSGWLCRPKRVFVVRNGLDLQRFHCSNTSAGQEASMAAVGSLIPVKRYDRLLRIVQQVKNRGWRCKVRIAGEGHLQTSLEKQARDLDLAGNIDFIGMSLNVPKLLTDSRFLMHTSEAEGQPNAVMEAMACGRPVVAMDSGDISTLVENGKTGFVVAAGDETSFVDKVCKLLADDDLCNQMGLAGRAKAEREFGLDRLLSETLDAYRMAGWMDCTTHNIEPDA